MRALGGDDQGFRSTGTLWHQGGGGWLILCREKCTDHDCGIAVSVIQSPERGAVKDFTFQI